MSTVNLIVFLFRCIIFVVGLILLAKIPFFATKSNHKKASGKKLLKLGWILYFASKCLIDLFGIILMNDMALPLILYTVVHILNTIGFEEVVNLLGYVGIALAVIGVVILLKDTRLKIKDKEKDIKKKHNDDIKNIID